MSDYEFLWLSVTITDDRHFISVTKDQYKCAKFCLLASNHSRWREFYFCYRVTIRSRNKTPVIDNDYRQSTKFSSFTKVIRRQDLVIKDILTLTPELLKSAFCYSYARLKCSGKHLCNRNDRKNKP
jgi:hypothetical protein